MRDIVGLYLDPPAHAAVFCVDEKPQIQALDRTQPLLPMQPGQVERRTHDYKRHGTTTLFAALNAQTSEVITQFHQRHRSAQFREFLDLIEAQVPRRLDVHIIMDNYSTHKTALIRNWFAKRPRFHVHYTPTYGSWLSLVERWFAELTMKQIRRGAYRSVAQLKAGIQQFIDAHHDDPKPFVWTKSADEILASIARFAQRTSDARAAQKMSRTMVTGHSGFSHPCASSGLEQIPPNQARRRGQPHLPPSDRVQLSSPLRTISRRPHAHDAVAGPGVRRVARMVQENSLQAAGPSRAACTAGQAGVGWRSIGRHGSDR